jgi:2-keto-3-deoxy-L-rhamnonate aldolase RhmA
VAEVFDACGFDWLAVDCEHSDIGLNETAGVLRGIRRASPLVRVSSNDTIAIRQALDCGAEGVIVPLVNSAEEAAAAAAAAHYPPRGVRGFSYVRANAHGLRFAEYTRDAASRVLVIVMVESRRAVENIDAILEVDGVDGVFVGPYDLSGSYDVPGQTDHSLVQEALDSVVTACRNVGKVAGQHVVKPDQSTIARALASGYRFLGLGMDTVFLADGARASLTIARQSRE